jgi:vesicle coat complex subunit/energy-coupling factor transporter ATP-binding protein EcfA2
MQEFILLTFATGIITRTAEMLLESSARTVKRRFEKAEHRQALEIALAEGLNSALALLRITDETEKQHYRGIFDAFFERPDVIDEFAQLIDPRPETTIDLELLENEFRAAGFEPEALPEFSFENFVRRFIGAFYDSAAKQPYFQTAVQIGLLRGIVERMDALQQNSERTADATEHIANGIDEIEQMLASFLDKQDRSNELLVAIENVLQQGQLIPQHQFLEKLTSFLNKKGFDIEISGSTGSVIIGDNNLLAEGLNNNGIQRLAEEMSQLRQAILGNQPTEEDLNALEKRYRQHIIHWFSRLTFAGMMRTAKAISLPLEEVYVELRAVAEVPEAADTFSTEERRLLLEKEDVDENSRRDLLRELDTLRRERWSRSIPERKSIAETLYASEQRAFVILGDPGSGKSTLLHFLALVHARGPQAAIEKLQAPSHEADRLPIFIPLAAFDDMSSRRSGLSMLEFLSIYYDQRRMLPGLKPLFERALESGRAIIFFDGLDEVLDTSRRAYVSQQVNAMIGEWGSRGVRFAVTSRFVGYREAPLSGNLPHLSVVDFGFEEIRTFVHQWSLAYERFAAGDIETPEVTRKAREMERNLLEDVASNASVRRLAANPLMLTMLALLRRQVGKLPHRRIVLYDRYISTLIENWVEARSEGARETSMQLLDLHQIENILMPLALWLQQNKPSGTASKAEIREELALIHLRDSGIHKKATAPQKKEAHAQADRFLREIRAMSGLIIERGQDAFGFLHLTFQEYFAGRALAAMSEEERWQMLLPHLHAPRWREPILLCAGRLGVVENRRPQVSTLARQILNCKDETEQDLRRNLLLVLAIAGDDVNLEPELINEIIQQAETCLPTRVYSLANLVIKGLGQIITNGIEGPASLIMKTLNDSDWYLRRTAIEALAGFVPTSATLRNALQAKLEDDDNDVRRTAVSALAPLASTHPDILTTLQAKLEDNDNYVRRTAVSALAPLASTHPDILTALQAKLEDNDNYVRSAALSALSPLASTHPDILAALQTKLEDNDNFVRSAAFSALAPLASTHPDILTALRAKLEDSNNDVRRAAVSALAPLASTQPDILAALQAKLEDGVGHVRSAAVNALAPLANTHPDILIALQAKLEDTYDDTRRAIVSALTPLANTHPDILTTLHIKLDDDNNDVRRAVVRALAPFQDTHSDIKNMLLSRHNHEHWQVRQTTIEMAESFFNLQEQIQLIYSLVQKQQAAESWHVRSAAVNALAPLASTHPDILTILQAKLEDTDYEVRSTAINALAPLASTHPDILTALQAKLEDGNNFFIRSAAISALAPLASTHPDILTALQTNLEDGFWYIRSTAISALAPLASTHPDILTALQAKLEDGNNFFIRSAAVSALAPLASTHPDILTALRAKLEDSNNDVRSAAVSALAPLTSTHPDILTALQAKLEDTDNFVRSAAVSALAPLASTHSYILTTLQVKLEDTDNFVRSAAVGALAPLASIHPDILTALQAKLEDTDNFVRCAAVSALAPLASTHPDILTALQAKLEDTDNDVRTAAVSALAPLASIHPELGDIFLDWLQMDQNQLFGSTMDTQELKNQIAAYLENRLEANLPRLLGWLAAPRWSSRAGAITALAHHYRQTGFPPNIFAKILMAMEDRRGLESYPARLSAAAFLINRDEYCAEAIQVCMEALEYGIQPWENLPESGQIREQAALVLGKLEPLRFHAGVYEKLLFVMHNDQNPAVRDSAYAALTRLARAREEQGLVGCET